MAMKISQWWIDRKNSDRQTMKMVNEGWGTRDIIQRQGSVALTSTMAWSVSFSSFPYCIATYIVSNERKSGQMTEKGSKQMIVWEFFIVVEKRKMVAFPEASFLAPGAASSCTQLVSASRLVFWLTYTHRLSCYISFSTNCNGKYQNCIMNCADK